MFFELDQDKVKHTRTVYSLWDVLSDIGGLFEILQYMAKTIVTLVSTLTGNQLNRFLIGSLLKFESKSRSKNVKTQTMSDIKRR